MSAVLKIEEIVLPEDIPLRNGLEVVFLEDYMVHFHNVKGLSGVIVKESTSFGKCIVYIQSLGMYCEPELDSILTAIEPTPPLAPVTTTGPISGC